MEVTIDIEAAEEGRRQVVELMRTLRAYDVMKETSKVLVYDTLLPFKHAYFSLVEYGACSGRRAARVCVCARARERWGVRSSAPVPVAPCRAALGRVKITITNQPSYDAQLVCEDHNYITIP